MIFCGPNANYAEQLQYNSDFLDFYLENGISVVTFNYRGFGLSEGSPSIPQIRGDAEMVANYIRSIVGPNEKIGVHGQSIGGTFAVHLARKGLVDFLYADRTFSALDEVPRFSMGAWAKYGLKFLTGWWDNDLTRDYVFTSCYKVIA